MRRKYFLYGEETTLEHIIEYLEDLVQNSFNPDLFEDLGISCEDVEEE